MIQTHTDTVQWKTSVAAINQVLREEIVRVSLTDDAKISVSISFHKVFIDK